MIVGFDEEERKEESFPPSTISTHFRELGPSVFYSVSCSPQEPPQQARMTSQAG